MKARFKRFLVLIFGFAALHVSAQQEFHFNVSNAIFYEVNGDFELGIEDYLSVMS